MTTTTIRGAACAVLAAAALTALAAPAPADKKARKTVQLQGHKFGSVWRVAFSPDGGLIATIGNDRTVKLWDARTGNCRHTIVGHERDLKWGKRGIVASLVFSPDGRTLATGGDDHTIRLWDTSTANNKGILRSKLPLSTVGSLAFSPDGRTLASGGGVHVRLWDIATLKEKSVAEIPDINRPVVGFDSRGRALALGRGRTSAEARYETAYVHDARTGKVLLTLKGHTRWISEMAFSPDGKTVVSVGTDNTVRIWGLADGKELTRCVRPRCGGGAPAFSPDGRLLAIAYKDQEADGSDSQPERGCITIYHTRSGRELLTLAGEPNPFAPLAFGPRAETFAAGLRREPVVQLWALPPGLGE